MTEKYWLACLKTALDTPAVLALRELLSSQDWQATLDAMLGYKVNQTGQVQSLSRELPWWQLKPRQTAKTAKAV